MRAIWLVAISPWLTPVLSAQTPLFRLDGTAPFDLLGVSVASVGDLDGDGFADFVVGASGSDLGGFLSGAMTVVSGATRATRFTIVGDSSFDGLGRSVASAGDVDGDGHPDVIVGAPGDSTAGSGAGKALVISGWTGEPILELLGLAPGSHLGSAVAGIGDIDGDDHDDLLVGAPGDDTAGADAGAAIVFSGAGGEPLLTVLGTSAGDAFGSAVAAIGDLTADTIPDFLVGAYLANSVHGVHSGRVQLFSGADGGELRAWIGDAANDAFGFSIAGVGDMDANGASDIAVGAYRDDHGGTDAGSVSIFSSETGGLVTRIDGDGPFDWFGWSVAGAGDLDGDSRLELVVGAPGVDASADATGVVRVFRSVDWGELFRLNGDTPGINFGVAVASGSDYDNDGLNDVIVGAFHDDGAGVDAGSVRVFSGTCLGPESYCIGAPNSTGHGAVLTSVGSTSVAISDFTLVVSSCPAHTSGVFLYGPARDQIPFRDGYLCVGAGTTGIFRVPPVSQVDDGGLQLHLNLQLPRYTVGPGALVPGSTWNFQFWYRNASGPGGTGSNLTNGLAVTFCR